MPLKQKSEFKRIDYIYESPDGDTFEITIVQTSDRKYIEIKSDNDETPMITWDVEMLLDIADAVRSTMQKPTLNTRSHKLKKPKVIDRRSDDMSPSDIIQASVDDSMNKIEQADHVTPVQSFSPDNLQTDIEKRSMKTRDDISPEKRVRKIK